MTAVATVTLADVLPEAAGSGGPKIAPPSDC